MVVTTIGCTARRSSRHADWSWHLIVTCSVGTTRIPIAASNLARIQARAYNGLVVAWPALVNIASTLPDETTTGPAQAELAV
jgi:hypothetical protein